MTEPRTADDTEILSAHPDYSEIQDGIDYLDDRGCMPGSASAIRLLDAQNDARGREIDRLNAALATAAGWDLFAGVAAITAWIDRSNAPGPHEDSMRVLKLLEEAGEAAAAYIGMVGQNPRKGVTHTMDDLLAELADVAMMALTAIQHFTQDAAVTRGVLASKVAGIMARSDIRALAETGA